MEASAGGEQREETERPPAPRMFTASNYFWLYYAVAPARGLTVVPVGKLAEAGECHAVLDDAADLDADSIPGSNSTYEFVGACADHPELLYTRTYSCACSQCRELSNISIDYKACPYMSTVGRWQQQTIHSVVSVPKQRQKQLLDTKVFGASIKANTLYAAYASYREERGGRSYWLLKTKSGALTGKTIRVPGGTTISCKTWYVEAQWYLSNSDNQGVKSYELLEGIVHIPVASLVQEHGLHWHRESRAQCLLSQEI